jgi:class 3 adenylate cyclase
MQRILLVEGDPTLREWFRLHLSAQGFLVSAFDGYRRALEAARTEPPDLLILATDAQASGAFALVAAVRSDVRSAVVPFLFLVPSHDAEALAQAMSIEPQGVVTKPVASAALMKAVASRLGAKDAPGLQGGLGSRGAGSIGALAEPGAVASGLMLDARDASVLVVMLRNFVSLARSLSAKTLDALLRRFLSAAREAVVDQGGWIVRADATGLVALFEEGPKTDRTHASRAIEAALGAVVAARRAKKWAESTVPNANAPDLSVGCGVHSGEVIIARLSVSGHLALTVAGQTADLAQRLDGRAKGIGWSVAVSEPAALSAGSRFQFGRRATLTDTDSAVTIAISEVLGFNPGTARPGELVLMAEAREAVLANTMLARLAGDVDQPTADKTIMVTTRRASPSEFAPQLPQRRIERKIGHGKHVNAFVAVHVESDREELVKTLRLGDTSQIFVEQYLEEYRKIAELNQRNILGIFEVGQTADVAYVATEYLPAATLSDAIRRKLPVGMALNCLAQMCLALDAIHGIGIVHGALRARHFLFRDDRVLVLSDFNTTERLGESLGLLRSSTVSTVSSGPGAQESGPREIVTARADFHSLGRILHEMLTGETTLSEGASGLFASSRLPLPLSPLQPCLDGLLGIGSDAPFETAEDIMVGLLALKEVFPFDIRHADVDSTAPVKQIGRRSG